MESRNERWQDMQDMQVMPLQKDETYEGEVHLSEERENGKENEIIMFKRELLCYEPATLFIEYKSTSSYLRGKKINK